MDFSNQFPIREKQPIEKPTVGKLWYDGKLLVDGKPFPFLQYKKKKLLSTGYYKKELFKITY